MRFLVGVLLLAAVTNAVELKSRSKQKTESDTSTKTEKRALKEGNDGVEKRLAVLPTALPSSSPGIVYADAKDLADKPPVQQIYSSPAPQIAKISDVLTGHGSSFPTAIASHLYSPVSIYQPRLATPTTYEVSAPVPSQLAYAEKISYQNPVQFTTQVLYNPQQQPQYFTKVNFPRFNALQFQQDFQQQNPRLFTHPQTFQAQAQTSQVGLNQQPRYQNPQNVQNAQVVYSQVQQQLAQLAQTVQPQQGIVYARPEKEKDNPKSTQRELNLKPTVEQAAVREKPGQSPNYNAQPLQNQDAVSFASFFQGPPHQLQQQQYQVLQQPQQQYQVLQHPQPQQYQALQQPQQQGYQVLQQPQPQQYQALPQPQTQQYLALQQPQQQQYQALQQPQQYHQLQPDLVQKFLIRVPQYQTKQQTQEQNQGQTQTNSQFPPPSYQSQPIHPQFQIQIPHYQPQQIRYDEPQFISKLDSPHANSIPGPLKQVPARQVVYLRQPQYQPQEYQGVQQQPQVFQGAPNVVQSAFPAVQYFGKFAQDIFGGLQHNH